MYVNKENCTTYDRQIAIGQKSAEESVKYLSSKIPKLKITKNWKIHQEMGIPDHLTCLLRNMYAGQEATVRTGHATTDWFKIRKGVRQSCIWSPYLFNFYTDYMMQNG